VVAAEKEKKRKNKIEQPFFVFSMPRGGDGLQLLLLLLAIQLPAAAASVTVCWSVTHSVKQCRTDQPTNLRR
jgi:hypothetical protein